MIVFARGFVTDPDALGPYVDEEMRVVGELKAEGVITAIYRRANGPGVYLILEGSSASHRADQARGSGSGDYPELSNLIEKRTRVRFGG